MCSPQVTGSPLAEIFWKAGPERTKAVFSVLLQKRVDTGELQIADVPMAASQFFTLIKGEAHARMVFGCCAQTHTPEAHLTRSEEHTSELQSLMLISYAVFCLKKKTKATNITIANT